MTTQQTPPTTVYIGSENIPPGQTGVVASSEAEAKAILTGQKTAPDPVASTAPTVSTAQAQAAAQRAQAEAEAAGKRESIEETRAKAKNPYSPKQQPEEHVQWEAERRAEEAEVKVKADIAYKKNTEIKPEEKQYYADALKARYETERAAEQQYTEAYGELGPAYIGRAVKEALGLDYEPAPGEAKQLYMDRVRQDFRQQELVYRPDVNAVANEVRAELDLRKYRSGEGYDLIAMKEDGYSNRQLTDYGFDENAVESADAQWKTSKGAATGIAKKVSKLASVTEPVETGQEWLREYTDRGYMPVRSHEGNIIEVYNPETGERAFVGPPVDQGKKYVSREEVLKVPGVSIRVAGGGSMLPSASYTGDPIYREMAQEALSFGAVDTRMLNEDDIRAQYRQEERLLTALYDGDYDTVDRMNSEGFFGSDDEGYNQYLEARDIAMESSRLEGEPTMTREQYVSRNLGSEEEYINKQLSQQPGVLSLAKEWIPFSEWTHRKEYTSRGALGYAELAGQTLLSASMVVPVFGWMGKGTKIALSRLTTGGRIAALGGRSGVQTALNVATKTLKEIEREIPAKQKQIKQAVKKLDDAERAGIAAEDIALRRAELDLLKSELKDLRAGGHITNLSAKKAEIQYYQDLLKAARKAPLKTGAEERAFMLSQRTMIGAAKLTPPLMYGFGATELGLTAYKWPTSTPGEKAMGLGMSALAFGLPGKVVGGIKSTGEIAFRPGRIPRRTIEVPSIYLPGEAGMPKTSVRGLTPAEQVAAMRTEADILERLWRGEGTASGTWPTGRTYRARAPFQTVFPYTSLSATPSGEVFGRPITTVQKFREPWFFSSPWAYTKFTGASAAGLKGTSPTILSVFSSEIKKYPDYIGEAMTPAEIARRANLLSESYRLEPGIYPGSKLYRMAKEPETISPLGTEFGTITGGPVPWFRERPFGPRIEARPLYVLGEEGAAGVGFTQRGIFRLKGMAPGAELRHWTEMLNPRRGLTGERSWLKLDLSLDPLRELRKGVGESLELQRKAESELKALRRRKAPGELAEEAKTAVDEARRATERLYAEYRMGDALRRLERNLDESSYRAMGEAITRAARARLRTTRTGRIPYTVRAVRDVPDFERAAREQSRTAPIRSTYPLRLKRIPTERIEIPRLETPRAEVPRDYRPTEREPVERAPRDIERPPAKRTPVERVPGEPERPPREGRPPRSVLTPRGRAPRGEEISGREIVPPPPMGTDQATEEQMEWPAGTITWRQGELHGIDQWVVIPPPYDKRVVMQGPPPGAKRIDEEGEGSAYRTVQVLGGNPPARVDVDLGWADITIIPTDGEPEIEFRSGGETTDAGTSDDSPTRGVTVRGEPGGTGARTARTLTQEMERSKPYRPRTRKQKKAVQGFEALPVDRFYRGRWIPDRSMGNIV